MPTTPSNPSTPVSGSGAVLLRDDFNGTTLNDTSWLVPEGAGTFLGRTQLRPPSNPPRATGGVLRLQVDTYNPTALTRGDSVWGSEIVSRGTFSPGSSGLSVRARVRLVSPAPRGLVASLFLYGLRGAVRDEIDFELLTNVADGQVLTNVFANGAFNEAGNPMLVNGARGVDEFNELEVVWRPDRIEWKVNGVVARAESVNVPQQPMTVRLNFWAAANTFPLAFDASLMPSPDVAGNRTFYYEVDWVEVVQL